MTHVPAGEPVIPHSLYRLHDATGQLLYIGITSNLGTRMANHRSVQPWWGDVATITAELHAGREAVLEAECLAIAGENPLWNVTYGTAPRKRSGVLGPAAIDWLSITPDLDPVQVARHFRVRTTHTRDVGRGRIIVWMPKDLTDPRARKNALAQVLVAAGVRSPMSFGKSEAA